jgi:hypothetical protein
MRNCVSLKLNLLYEILGIVLTVHKLPREVVRRIEQGHGQFFEPCGAPVNRLATMSNLSADAEVSSAGAQEQGSHSRRNP